MQAQQYLVVMVVYLLYVPTDLKEESGEGKEERERE